MTAESRIGKINTSAWRRLRDQVVKEEPTCDLKVAQSPAQQQITSYRELHDQTWPIRARTYGAHVNAVMPNAAMKSLSTSNRIRAPHSLY